MADAAHIDFETRSTVDLRKSGVYPYFEGSDTSVLVMCYRLGDGPVRAWKPGEDDPLPLLEHVSRGGRVVCHNIQFDRTCWNAKAPAHWPRLAIEQCDCTMARAQAMGLPGALAELGEALKITMPKDLDGHRLMMSMCKPIGSDAAGNPLWKNDAQSLDRLTAYCGRDVEAESEIDRRLPALSERERRVWELDQRINDRGVAVDVPLCRRALAAVEEALRRANRRVWELTGGAVNKVTEVGKIVGWIDSQGLNCESIAEGEFEGLLVGSELFDRPEVAEVVRLRQSSAKAFKFQAMINHACSDGRVRGSLAYHGTLTGRWAGRGVQPQNFKRIETEEDDEVVQTALRVLARSSSAGEAVDLLEMFVGEPLEALSLLSRPMLVSGRERRLVGGDFSNIEGRLAAWLAGETWKLRAFEDYDRGVGPDLYKVTAGRIIGVDHALVTRAQRQEQGKVPELACGYGGALGAFKKMGAKYGVRLSDGQTMQIVRGWRDENPRIVAAWEDLQTAAIEAVRAPGCVVNALDDKIAYVVKHGFLLCLLPSGRVISYASPSVEWKTKEITIDGEVVEINRLGVSYWSTEGGKRARKQDLYGGKQFAHVVSGTARDVLVDAMFAADDAGYPIVLTVHDEIVTEVEHAGWSANDLTERMVASSRFKGLPVSVKAWEGNRYVHG